MNVIYSIADGRMYSVGTMFREQAALIGVSVPEYSRLLLAQLQNPNSERRFDVDLDFRTCELIAGMSFGVGRGEERGEGRGERGEGRGKMREEIGDRREERRGEERRGDE